MRLCCLLVALAACVRSASVTCEIGGTTVVCPEGTVCTTLEHHPCVPAEQIAACVGLPEFAICGDDQRCYSGACLPAGCGNGVVDPGEACDDANAIVGDGCSAGCLSLETCGNAIVDPIALDARGEPVLDEECDDGNLIGHDGCASCASERLEWERLVVDDVPDGRVDHAIAFDAGRRRYVMFGGQTSTSQTLESDGQSWSFVPTSLQPQRRIDAAMTYDAARRRVVLFGGESPARFFDDTWSWDGFSWIHHAGVAPPGRSRHAIAYDSKRAVVVVFGGRSEAGALGDTWEWNGTRWTAAQTAASPPARFDHAMAYDPSRGVIVMVGGRASDDDPGFASTWEYDGVTWREIVTTTPTLASGIVAYDSVGVRMLAYRGVDQTTWVYENQAWRQLPIDPVADVHPVVSVGFAAASNAIAGHIFLWGGRQTNTFMPADIYRWDGSRWTRTVAAPDGQPPPGRIAMAWSYDPTRRLLIAHGGPPGQPEAVREIVFDGFRFAVAGNGPPSRVRPAMAYDGKRDRMIYFGGYDQAGQTFAETWARAGSGTWTQLAPPTSPPALAGHAMAYDPLADRILLFGGSSTAFGFATQDTWEWDGQTWAKREPATRPRARYGAALAYDYSVRRLVLVGGAERTADGDVLLDDTWEWTGDTWEERPSGLDRRRDLALVWSPARTALVAYGGFSGGVTLADSWIRTPSGFGPLPVLTMSPRSQHALIPTLDGAGLVVWGGSLTGSEVSNVTTLERLQADRDVSYEQCEDRVDNDGDTFAGCADPDCWTYCTPWCSPIPGDPTGGTCAPDLPRCGDGTCNPVLENCRNCATDCTCAAVCGDFVCDPSETCPGDCP